MKKKVLFTYDDIRDLVKKFQRDDDLAIRPFDAMLKEVADEVNTYRRRNPNALLYVHYLERDDEGEYPDDHFEGMIAGHHKVNNPPLLLVHFPEGSSQSLNHDTFVFYEDVYKPNFIRDVDDKDILPNIGVCGEYSHRIVEIYVVIDRNPVYAGKLERWDD